MYRTSAEKVAFLAKEARLARLATTNANNNLLLKRQNQAKKYANFVYNYTLKKIEKSAKRGEKSIKEYQPWFSIFIYWTRFSVDLLISQLENDGFEYSINYYNNSINIYWY